MAENNFYEWLGLSVEQFESDPFILNQILNKLIEEWKSSQNPEIKKRTGYKYDIIDAFQSPTIWIYMYNKYKKRVDKKIIALFDKYADSTNDIHERFISLISKKCNVSTSYVEKMATNNGYNIYDGEQSAEVYNRIKGMLDGIQGIIIKLGFNDLSELIESECEANINLSSVAKDEVVAALKYIKKKWSRTHASNWEGRQRRINIDRMCSGMLYFLSKYEISDYLLYLQNL